MIVGALVDLPLLRFCAVMVHASCVDPRPFSPDQSIIVPEACMPTQGGAGALRGGNMEIGMKQPLLCGNSEIFMSNQIRKFLSFSGSHKLAHYW